ncbi:MAG: beta-ketoacyl-ACP synthase III [Bacteroidota bacterium]|nr:beta-ketoacyl-ACP synthase III [Bacteroidota bacterium]MDP4234358.1 beta-ketoacyl-ACP synthase III [Bacteroidota bacterium]MDP4243291.1 beta-ketoacyl-ACP synthase III [Bacteroidota bacterium]MDP4287976.1 beta-ketoacyl-ACP synthase III [Bacteroidota bacterium]
MSAYKLHAAITSVGHYVPPDVLDNAFFESYLDTSDEWIRTRTGIKERRILKQGATSDMAVLAAKQALERRGWTPDDVELIICCTVTPDMMFPSTACLIQEKLGAKNCWGYDLVAACSSFLFGVETAAQFVTSGRYKRVLLIGADKMSAIADYQDRNTCVLFGDGAGAITLEPSEEEIGILDSYLRVDGSGAPFLHMKAGGSLRPASHETVENRWHYVYQEGKQVFKRAVVDMAESSARVVERNGMTGKDISFLVPHQANLRIIDAARERMGLSPEQVMINIQKYGNTTSATIPICLSEWWADGKLKKGDNIVLSSFGAGYTWGAILVRWAY